MECVKLVATLMSVSPARRYQLFMHGTCALPAVCHALATVETPRSPFGLGAAGAVLLAGCHDGAVAHRRKHCAGTQIVRSVSICCALQGCLHTHVTCQLP